MRLLRQNNGLREPLASRVEARLRTRKVGFQYLVLLLVVGCYR